MIGVCHVRVRPVDHGPGQLPVPLLGQSLEGLVCGTVETLWPCSPLVVLTRFCTLVKWRVFHNLWGSHGPLKLFIREVYAEHTVMKTFLI